jgi:hypothetical protein
VDIACAWIPDCAKSGQMQTAHRYLLIDMDETAAQAAASKLAHARGNSGYC